MMTVSQFLLFAGVRHEPYKRPPIPGVVITAANQLMGSYTDFARFRGTDPNYRGWHAHHIVEFQDFARLGVTRPLPAYGEQLCVLIPERAHIGRVNSILNRRNPQAVVVTASELRSAYHDAYMMIGDYCGGGEVSIRRELLAVVDATFKSLGVI